MVSITTSPASITTLPAASIFGRSSSLGRQSLPVMNDKPKVRTLGTEASAKTTISAAIIARMAMALQRERIASSASALNRRAFNRDAAAGGSDAPGRLGFRGSDWLIARSTLLAQQFPVH